MLIGILKEIKTEENRVCMTPAGVEVMVANGHAVLVEKMPVSVVVSVTTAMPKPEPRWSTRPRRFMTAPIW